MAGVDYGAKLSGNTVISMLIAGKITQYQTKPKQDADVFLYDLILEYQVTTVFIDAPLSLPLSYSQAVSDPDFFYRLCDRETQAMSPLFLGGLTARAIQLKYALAKHGVQLYETYPSCLARQLNLLPEKDFAGIEANVVLLKKCLAPYEIDFTLKNRHQLDSLLALYSAIRHAQQQCLTYGDPTEGIIYV